MIVSDRCLPPALPSALVALIRSEIHGALKGVVTHGGKFVVNDSSWLAQRGKAFTPVVMNDAEHISKRFQQNLETSFGWTLEHLVEEQKIDGYKEFKVTTEGFYLDETGLKALIETYWDNKSDFAPLVRGIWPFVVEPSIDQLVWWVSQMYVKRRLHDVSVFPPQYRRFFVSTGEVEHTVRVGLEYESGYTASAYRSLMKLNVLYAAGCIDLGVFVATSKTHAIRLWPVSNRNVNYDELERRRYKRNVYFPIWEVLFEPDGYSTTAGYLDAGGGTYQPTPTPKSVIHEQVSKPLYTRADGKFLIQDS